MQAQDWFYGSKITFTYYFLMAARNTFCKVAVIYERGEAARMGLLEWVQTELKIERQQMCRPTIRENLEQHVGICNGRTNDFEVSSSFDD